MTIFDRLRVRAPLSEEKYELKNLIKLLNDGGFFLFHRFSIFRLCDSNHYDIHSNFESHCMSAVRLGFRWLGWNALSFQEVKRKVLWVSYIVDEIVIFFRGFVVKDCYWAANRKTLKLLWRVRPWTQMTVFNALYCEWTFYAVHYFVSFSSELVSEAGKCSLQATVCSLRTVVECHWKCFFYSYRHCFYYFTCLYTFGFFVGHVLNDNAQFGVIDEFLDRFWCCRYWILSMSR